MSVYRACQAGNVAARSSELVRRTLTAVTYMYASTDVSNSLVLSYRACGLLAVREQRACLQP